MGLQSTSRASLGTCLAATWQDMTCSLLFGFSDGWHGMVCYVALLFLAASWTQHVLMVALSVRLCCFSNSSIVSSSTSPLIIWSSVLFGYIFAEQKLQVPAVIQSNHQSCCTLHCSRWHSMDSSMCPLMLRLIAVTIASALFLSSFLRPRLFITVIVCSKKPCTWVTAD